MDAEVRCAFCNEVLSIPTDKITQSCGMCRENVKKSHMSEDPIPGVDIDNAFGIVDMCVEKVKNLITIEVDDDAEEVIMQATIHALQNELTERRFNKHVERCKTLGAGIVEKLTNWVSDNSSSAEHNTLKDYAACLLADVEMFISMELDDYRGLNEEGWK